MATTLCPKCSQSVGIPIADATTAVVRCPHCEAEYPLRDALLNDEPAFIVLESAESLMATIEDVPERAADELTVTDGSETVELSHVDWQDASDTMPLDGKEQSKSVAADDAIDMAPADEASTAEAPVDEITWEAAPEEQATEEAGAAAESFDTAVGAAVATRPGARKKRRGPGMVTQFVGIAVFGLIGIVLGYFILRWIKPSAAAEIDRNIANVFPWWGKKAAPVTTKPEKSKEEGDIVAPGSALPKDDQPAPTENPATVPIQVPPIDTGKGGFGEPEDKPLPDTPPAPPDQPAPVAEVPFTGSLTAESVTPAELEAAWKAADKAIEGRTSTVRAAEFFALSDLGHAVALVEDPAHLKTAPLLGASAVVLRNASGPARRVVIENYGYQWLTDSRRPENRNGIWLLGKVESVGTLTTPHGNLTETRLAVVGTDKKDGGKEKTMQVSVVSVKRPDYQPGDTAGILGTIVNKPAQTLTWYSGSEPLLVLSGVAVKLAEK